MVFISQAFPPGLIFEGNICFKVEHITGFPLNSKSVTLHPNRRPRQNLLKLFLSKFTHCFYMLEHFTTIKITSIAIQWSSLLKRLSTFTPKKFYTI
jgi:hypothetical protein